MANASNNHNKNNQPRRKRNKKPVKRYSEEYSNRPNPYTGYTSDGNYHPEAMKHTQSSSSSARAKAAAEEERLAAINAAMTEVAWGPAPSTEQQPAQPAEKPTAKYVPPTVTVPAPKWAVSNNLTRQQMAEQEASGQAQAQTETGSPAPEPTDEHQQAQTVTPRKSGSHRKKNHRGKTKEESNRERAAKTEAKRAAMDKIAKGVAAHSVSEQMIDDIASMSDAMINIPKQPKAQSESNGVNWEEFYDAAFPPKSRENSKFADKKSKHSKKRVDFKEDTPADEPMIVKPVMLGDDDLLPYDKIARENALEEAEAEAAAAAQAAQAAQASAVPESNAAMLAAESKTEEKPSGDDTDVLSPLIDLVTEAPDTEAADDVLDDIADVVSTVSIEQILASVEQQKLESVKKAEALQKGAEFAVNTPFDFDTNDDDSWNELIPSRIVGDTEETPAVKDSESLLSERLMQSYIEAEQQTDIEPDESEPDELDNIETVDLNQFLHGNDRQNEAADETPDRAEDFVPEIIIDSAELDKKPESDEPAASDAQPETDETPEAEVPTAETPEEQTADATQEKETSVFIEESVGQPDVEVIIADLGDDIFAKEKIANPQGESEEEAAETGIEVEDKIEKLAEAAEVAEVFRQESEDMLPEDEREAGSADIFSVSLDDVAVSPQIRASEDEEVKEYQPREKTREPDETLFESVLIVDDNPSIIDKQASAGQDDTLFIHTREQPENPTAVFKLPEGPIVFPTDIDDAEFQEHWLDEDEDGDDMASRNKRTRRRISAFIGAVALLFAIMILFSAVKTVVSGFTNIGSTSEKKTEYTEFISPVVINDPMPFESVEKADNNMLLKSSIWQALRELDETEGYEHVSDATDKIVLPADMVEKAAKELFGKDVNLNMNVLSEYDGSAIYYYDSIDNSFHITRSGITGPSAIITKIAQKSDYISLVVGYIGQEEMTLTSSESSEAECYKFMEYILALNSNGSYYIKSIRNYVDD